MKKSVKKPKKTVAASKAKKPDAKKPAAKPAPAKSAPTKAKIKSPDRKPLVKASPEKKAAPAPILKKAAAPAPAKKEDPKKPAPKIEAKDSKKELHDKVVANKKPDPKAAAAASAAGIKGASKTSAPSPIKVEPKIIETSQVEYVKPNLDEQLFTEDELRMFRDLLDTERNKILHKARKAMEEGNMQFAKDDMMDEVDQASAMIEQNLTFRLLDRDRKLLSEIDHAIAKLETGEYGYCEGTGEPIPKRRLELRPWCRHSVKYKEKLERMKKSGRGVVDEDEM